VTVSWTGDDEPDSCSRGRRSSGSVAATRRTAFTGGTIHRVAIDVSGDPYIDLEREAAAMLARE